MNIAKTITLGSHHCISSQYNDYKKIKSITQKDGLNKLFRKNPSLEYVSHTVFSETNFDERTTYNKLLVVFREK